MSESIFNEANYLNGNPENIKLFVESYQDRLEKWETERAKFSNVFKNYDEFITMVATCLKNLDFKDQLEYSMFIKLLVDKGYLSHNLFLERKSPKEDKEITSRLGVNIVVGNGTCRHYSRMHQDIFKKLDLPLFLFYCYEGDLTLPESPDMEANHVVSLLPYDGQVYGLDIFNGYHLFGFKTPFILEEISTKTHHTLRYKPYIEMIMGESTLPQIKRRINAFEAVADRYSMEPEEWEEKRNQMKKRILFLNECCVPYEIHEATEEIKEEIESEIHSLTK